MATIPNPCGETIWSSAQQNFTLLPHSGMATARAEAQRPNVLPKLAAHWAKAYMTGPNDAADSLNLYDVSGLAHYELYHAIAQAGYPAWRLH